MREQIAEAYRRGYFAGAADTRDRILKAASTTDAKPELQGPLLPSSEGDAPSRVERGAVRIAVRRVMSARPGLSTTEVAKRVVEFDPRITAPGSVSNELNRNKGKLYEQRGTLWFPMDENEEGPAVEARPSLTNGAAVRAA